MASSHEEGESLLHRGPEGKTAYLDRLPMWKKLVYGSPMFAGAALGIPIAVHINKFYTDVLLVPAGHLAFCIAIARACDCLFDPLFGWISDNARTVYGRRRPFIAVGSVFCAAVYWLLFSPPRTLDPYGATLWFGLLFALYFICLSTFMVPYNALGAELTLHYHERSSLFAWKYGFALCGIMLAAVSPGLVMEGIHDERTVFMFTSLFISVLVILLYPAMAVLIKERVIVHVGNPMVPGLRRALRNRPFVILMCVYVVGSVPVYSIGTLLPFYIDYVIAPANEHLWLSLYLALSICANLISVPLWLRISRIFGKRAAWQSSWMFGVFGGLGAFFLGKGDTIALAVVVTLVGFGAGAAGFLHAAIEADIIDYDELHTGKRREGQFLTFWSMLPKLIAIPGASIPFSILGHLHYTPSSSGQTDTIVLTIRILFCVVPAFFSFLAFCIAYTFPITERHHKLIRVGIAKHKAGDVAEDPVTGKVIAAPGSTDVPDELGWFLDYFSEGDLRRVLDAGPRGLHWRAIAYTALWACVWVPGLLFVVLAIPVFGREPGLVETLVLVVSCLGFAFFIFSYLRIAPCRHMERHPVAPNIIHAHLAFWSEDAGVWKRQ